jgi:hypothetical protein
VFSEMANSIDFTISLIDKMTGPAKQAAAAVAGLEAQLKAVAAATEAMPTVSGLSSVGEANLGLTGFEEAGTMQASVALLAQAVDQLSVSIVELEDSLGGMGVAGDAFGGAVRGIFSAVGEKMAAGASDGFVNKMRESAAGMMQKTSDSLGKAFGNSGGIKGAFGNALTSITKVIGEGLAGGVSVETLVAAGGALKGLALAGGKVILIFGAIAAAAAAAVAAVALVGAAALAAGAAMVALTIAGAKMALSAAEAKQDTLDMLEAMLGTEQAANATYGQLLAITKISSASKEQVTSAAQELSAAGVTNQRQLVEAVKSIAQIESVLKGGGAKIQGILEKAAQTGKFEVNAKKLAGTGVQVAVLYEELSRRTGLGVKQVEAQLKAGKIKAEVGIDALTATIDKKFGGVAAKQALDFGVQMQRLKDNIGGLFADVKTGPFLDALNEIVSVFDSTTPAGGAMKDILSGAFNTVFKIITAGAPYVKTFLKGLVIIALQIAIAMKPLIAKLREAFGGDARKGPLGLAKAMSLVGLAARKVTELLVAVTVAEPVWKTLGFTVDALVFTMKGLALVMGAVAAPFIMVGLAIYSVIRAVVAVIGWFGQLIPKALEAGGALVAGLVDGIALAAGSLYGSVSNLATTALNLFKKKFGIASPSKVMMGMGVNLSLGLAQGIKAGAPAANDNFREVLTPPRAIPSVGSQGRGAQIIFNEGAVVLQINGSNAREIADQLEPMMADILERAALSQGTAA